MPKTTLIAQKLWLISLLLVLLSGLASCGNKGELYRQDNSQSAKGTVKVVSSPQPQLASAPN